MWMFSTYRTIWYFVVPKLPRQSSTRNSLPMAHWSKSWPGVTEWWSSSQWRHNEREDVSNHRCFDRLLNRLYWRTSKKTSELLVTGLCEGNPLVTGGLPSHRASYVENVSIRWRHHMVCVTSNKNMTYLPKPNWFSMIYSWQPKMVLDMWVWDWICSLIFVGRL